MNPFPWDLAGAAGLLLLNRVTTRPMMLRGAVYFPLQVCNLAGLAWFLVFGVRGLEHMPATAWAVAGLFGLHLVMNASQRSRAQHDQEIRR